MEFVNMSVLDAEKHFADKENAENSIVILMRFHTAGTGDFLLQQQQRAGA
jgi:hypothetical protein